MIPNSLMLQVGVMPLREPDRVELRARFPADTTPSEVQEMLSDQVEAPMRYPPHIELEELERDQVVLKITAVPERRSDGSRLASEILAVARSRGPGRPGSLGPTTALALALQLGDQHLRVHRRDQVLERLGSGLDQLHRPVGVHLPGEAVHQDLDLLADQLLHRPLVAQGVVDGEADLLLDSRRPGSG